MPQAPRRTTRVTNPPPGSVDGGATELRVAVDRLGRLLASRRAYSRLITAAGSDLSQQSSMLLTTLFLHGRSATISDLAAMTRMDLSAASRQLRNLERANLVERSPDATDRRVIHLHLTEAGTRKIESVLPGHVAALVEEFGVLSAAEQETLGKLCKKLGMGRRSK